MVSINPEARVKVSRGPASARLTQGGWTSFLVKVHNEAGVTARLRSASPQALQALHISSYAPRALPDNKLSPGDVQNRFLEMQMYQNPPLLAGIYPLPSRRVASADEYPDFFFQPQVYRADGEQARKVYENLLR